MKDQMQEMKEVVDEIRRAPRAVLPIAVTPEAYQAICEDADKNDVSITAILRHYLKLGAEAAGSPLARIPMYPNLKRRRDFPRKAACASANLGFSERSAQLYMRLARASADGRNITDMSINSAMKMLAKPRTAPPTAADDDGYKPQGRGAFEAIGAASTSVEPSGPVPQTQVVVWLMRLWSQATPDQREQFLMHLRWQKVLPEMEAA